MKKSILASLGIILLPLLITACYTLTEVSIGPVVLFYSIITGVALGAIWGRQIGGKCPAVLAFLLGGIIGIICAVLMVNLFVLITHAFGEMDYHLM